MWAYLEQQSFPLDEIAYRNQLDRVLNIVNRLGLSDEVRDWLAHAPKRPRLGKAISLELKGGAYLEEFILGTDQ